jgi:hypothetical protein
MCTLVLVLVQHVSAVRHLQVLCFYLLAETVALLYFVFICPHGCHFYVIKSYIKSVTLVKISKITCFIRSLNLGQYFHISLASAIRRCRLVYLSGTCLCVKYVRMYQVCAHVIYFHVFQLVCFVLYLRFILLFMCFKRPVGRAVVLLRVLLI